MIRILYVFVIEGCLFSALVVVVFGVILFFAVIMIFEMVFVFMGFGVLQLSDLLMTFLV